MKTAKITAWYIILILAAIAVSLISPHVPQTRQLSGLPPTWQVHFSPRGGATSAIKAALDRAEQSVLVQAYSFTSAPIAEALVRAHKRGVNVQVILDRSQRTQKYTISDMLILAGIPVLFDASHTIAHNKVIIIDSVVVITGSFNFTKAAEERNAENLLIVNDSRLATLYTDNWHHHQRHSITYLERGRPIHNYR
jgi:phosphatidylserine/phosphatidylglycerophosphate/cardiolipin synthase-like enzyme